MTITRAVIVVSQPIARERFCGRTLVERHAELLHRAGVADVDAVAASEMAGHRRHDVTADQILLVTAERLFDPRLYAALLAHGVPARITDGGNDVGIEMVHGAGMGAAGAPSTSVDVQSIDPYSRELRRSMRPYWMRVATLDDRPAVTRVLVEASRKGHPDLPAMLINAPLETAVLRLLANTRVTPNQITGVCNLLAYAVAALLATGHLLAGAVGAVAVGVIDGIDGRQARVQVRTTPFGRLEHLLDKVYEILWIVALAYWLSGGFADRSYVTPLVAWIAAYLLDTAAYDAVKQTTGATLDEASRLDAVIRLVAGRRNVYACMLLAGALAGQADRAFRAIVWWAVVTAAVHGLRGLLVTRKRRWRVLV